MTGAGWTVHVSDGAARVAEILLSIRAVTCDVETPFRSTSGRASPLRVDSRKPLSFADERREILRRMAEAVRTDPFDVIAGGETEGVPYGVWVADLVGLPYVSVRREPKRIEGELLPGQKALLVEDLASDGRSIVDLVHALRGAGAVCEHVVVVCDDVHPAPEAVPDVGITLHVLTTWRHVIDAAERTSAFPPAQIRGLRAFLENPEAWSQAHGGT